MKKIEKLLTIWRKERNITGFLTIKEDMLDELREVKEAIKKLDLNNYVEELADIAIFAFNGIGILRMEYKSSIMNIEPSLHQVETYIESIRLEIPFQLYTLLCAIITVCNELVTLKRYDFRKVLEEKIKVLQSRRQDSNQKKHWALHGSSGKWQKSTLDIDIKALYVGNYGKCKIGFEK